ncbi:MAG TPA: carboxypeptidase regulatory-like domain-containing protein [Gemmatimonadaceae bacterium]|nr:carboxypeptidase regulatory-like domain-containing protein [Gemmatimonadaceae bacterium]
MHTTRWLRPLAVLALAAGVVLPARVAAQGVTTAAITGTITDSTTGQPVDAAQVTVVNVASGVALTAQSRPSGVYFVSGLAVGGPYKVTVRRIGYRPTTVDAGNISLGQRKVVDVKLEPQAATLAAITVEGGGIAAPIINPNRRGTASLVNDSTLQNAPTLNRNFTDFVKTVPQVTSAGPGSSAGGVNNRYNNIQIDGSNSNDLFGLGSTGQPGGQSAGKSISLDAVQEYQVLLAPYDLRYSQFNGMLVNAVTKRGTNDFTGSLYYYYRSQNMAAPVAFIQQSDLSVAQYGFSAGGPIIKDKLHFFVAGEWQDRSQPSVGPYIGQSSNAASPLTVDSATVQRFINDLTNQYGMTAGTGGVANIANPNQNFFARLDYAIPAWNSILTVRDNYATSSLDVFSRTSPTTFALTSNLYTIKNDNNSIVAQLTSNFANGKDNEFIFSYNTITDNRTPAAGFEPQITVAVPGLQSSSVNLVAGAEQFSQGNVLDQKMIQLQDNYSFYAGDENRVTLGVASEWWQFTNTFTESSYGVWTFNSLDSLEAGNANRYRLSLALTNPPSVIANPQGVTYAAYIMDNWTPSQNFNLLFGVRVDDPVITNSPPYTASFDTIFGPTYAALGRQANTTLMPSGNVEIAPRVGFNWDVNGDGKHQVRGGIGVFDGRPAYVWVSNSFQNSGSGLGFLQCGRATDPGPITPAFNPNSAAQPQTCANGAGVASGVVGPTDTMDPSLLFPQVLRGNLAYDTRLPGDWFLTLEGMYTQGLHNFFYVNRNINYNQSYIGRNGRYMYGTLANNGVGTTYVVDTTHRYAEVIDVVNESKDYSYNLTVQLQKRIIQSLQMNVAYTYSAAYDVQSLTSSRAISNWNFGRDEAYNLLATNPTRSIYSQPNKLLISADYTFPWKKWATQFFVIYTGYTGQPFDYVYSGSGGRGDMNGDGNVNDIIYVPKNPFDTTEIKFATIPASGGKSAVTAQQQALALYNLIQSTPCLKRAEGSIMGRNACFNPWVNQFDMSIIQQLPQVSGHRISVRLDIFNMANFLYGGWGKVHLAGLNSDVPLLTVTGMTPVAGCAAGVAVCPANAKGSVPIVQFQPTYVQYPVQNSASNYYQLQLSARFEW